MPSRIPKACRVSSCPKTTSLRHGYCEAHADKDGWSASQKGKTTTERGYGHRWRKRRDRILQRDSGLCQPCLKVERVTSASSVDHIIPKAEGGTDADNNLQAICNPCHKSKTQDESQRGRAKR